MEPPRPQWPPAWSLANNFQYTAAAKTNALDSAARSLDTLSSVFKKDPKLATVLGAPTLSVSDKQQIIAELQNHLGGQDKDGIVKNLLETLANNNRLGALEGVVEKFAQLISAYRGEVELTVTSAAPLDNRTLSRLESAVSKSHYVSHGHNHKVVAKDNTDIRC